MGDTYTDNFSLRAKAQTRTLKTDEDYIYRAGLLVKRYRREQRVPTDEPINSIAFVDWLICLQPKLKYASWRQYQSAIRATLTFPDFTELPYDKAAYQRLSEADPQNCKQGRRGETSSKKIKRLPATDYRKLIDCLSARGGVWSKAAKVWLQAGVLTGLRPIEWLEATIETEAGMHLVTPGADANSDPEFHMPPAHPEGEKHQIYRITVRNAKATNGRANGKYRTLELPLTRQEAVTVARQIYVAKLYEARPNDNGYGGFKRYYKSTVDCLSDTCEIVWPRRPKHYTLYSARHQFAANQKAAGKSKNEIAEMMGHSDIQTAGRFYAKRRSGWGFNNGQQANLDVADINSRSIPGL